MEAEYWKGAFFVYHISSYALTVEPKTAMSKMIQTGKMEAKRRRGSRTFYDFARHARIKWVYPWIVQFWQTELLQKITRLLVGKNICIGPSAHGYNGISRSWNVSNNIIYLKSIQEENYQMK
jgi:oxygen-independent coproporphyrinogen-3 oxidase